MNKLAILLIFFGSCQITFAQTENLNVDGAINISNSEAINPAEGTIRWTGLDFEGFDGTVWKSLTCCDSGPDSDAQLNCPAQNFILTDCNFIVNWSHQNPESTIVNYDTKINGEDSADSVVYPATFASFNICNILDKTSGTGSFNIELFYWYDGITTNQISAGVCTINYDFGSSPGHEQGKTFAQIEADTDLPNFCDTSDDAYVAEFLYQRPEVCYWEVQTLPDGQKCVVPLAVPSPPSNAIFLPNPSGGNDTGALESVINGNGPNKVFVGTGTYKVNQLDIDLDGTVIHNMSVTPAPGAGELIHINADDVKLIDCPQDLQNQGSAYLGIRAYYADRFHLIRSGMTNMFHTGGSSGGGVLIRGSADFHIAGGVYKNILNPINGVSVCRANAFWMNGGSVAPTDGGYIVNNSVENLQSGGQPVSGNKDAEFLTIQSNTDHLKQVKVFANRCVDAGKRLLKSQADGGATVLSNYYEWKTNSTVLGNRTRLAMIAVHFQTGDVIVRNNRLAINGNRNWGYVMNIQPNTKSGVNIHFDCNQIEINNPWNGQGYDQRILVANSIGGGSVGTDSSQESINCTMDNNTIFGTGGVNYHYWFGRGFDLTTGLLQPSGNTFNLSDSSSPHQGVEKK